MKQVPSELQPEGCIGLRRITRSKADVIYPSNHPCASIVKKMGLLTGKSHFARPEIRLPREQLISFRLP